MSERSLVTAIRRVAVLRGAFRMATPQIFHDTHLQIAQDWQSRSSVRYPRRVRFQLHASTTPGIAPYVRHAPAASG